MNEAFGFTVKRNAEIVLSILLSILQQRCIRAYLTFQYAFCEELVHSLEVGRWSMESWLAFSSRRSSEASAFIHTSQRYNGIAKGVGIMGGKKKRRDSSYVENSGCYVKNSRRMTVTVWSQLQRAMCRMRRARRAFPLGSRCLQCKHCWNRQYRCLPRVL